MAWEDAYAALVTDIEDLGYKVYRTPPLQHDARSLMVVLVPPRRQVVRPPSGPRRTIYSQRIRVLHPVGEAVERIGTAIDQAVERINDQLDRAIMLHGHAQAVEPPDWDELHHEEYPPGTGQNYFGMTGEFDITLERPGEYQP